MTDIKAAKAAPVATAGDLLKADLRGSDQRFTTANSRPVQLSHAQRLAVARQALALAEKRASRLGLTRNRGGAR